MNKKTDTKTAIESLRSELSTEMESARSPLEPAADADKELYEAMAKAFKKLGIRGLDRLMSMGAIDKDEAFVAPKPVAVNPLDPKGPEWAWGKKAWKDARDEVIKRGDGWVMTRDGMGPNYAAIYSLWKDEFAKEFGFRPTRTKEKSMTKAMEDAMRKAVKLVVKVIGTISPEEMEKARAEK